jgi:cell division protein FtsB
MSLLWEIKRRARHVVLPVVCVSAMAYSAYHIVQGERGLKRWWSLQKEIADADSRRDRAGAERARLQFRAGLMRDGQLDADMVDEQARRMLNVARRDELVIFYDRPIGQPPARAPKKTRD